jgi:hypothetical protein
MSYIYIPATTLHDRLRIMTMKVSTDAASLNVINDQSGDNSTPSPLVPTLRRRAP